MTATTIPATADAITTHDEWVAFYTAPQNVSAFAQEVIGDEVTRAFAGDYYAQEFVAGQVHSITRLEALSDGQLRAELAENQANHYRAIADDDFSEYDVNDYESYYYQQGLIEALLDHRRVLETYTGHGPLVYNPFAALAAAS
jgi:hypothetical protein